MTYHLIIGDRAYSSWSLRAWLLFDTFGIPVRTRLIDFDTASVAEHLADLAPARTVPALQFDDGTIVADSLAIAEELASRHPEAGLWPSDPAARATARWLGAEMHSGFSALRGACPMNLRTAYGDVPVGAEVRADLDRIEALWAHARARHGSATPWLFGGYSVADAFFAPVAARIAGYGLSVGAEARAFVDAHLAHAPFRRWRAMGCAKGATLQRYARSYPTRPWPGPAPLAAHSVTTGTPENDRCPYSGRPVQALMRLDGRTFGFCNDFCRDKTVADPEAWPAFAALL